MILPVVDDSLTHLYIIYKKIAQQIHHEITWTSTYPLVNQQFAIENGPFIVDLPINSY